MNYDEYNDFDNYDDSPIGFDSWDDFNEYCDEVEIKAKADEQEGCLRANHDPIQ